MNNGNNPFNWQSWVPDPVKIYVTGEADLPIKVNPIFRGKQPLSPVENDLCSVLIPFHEPFLTIYEECIKTSLKKRVQSYKGKGNIRFKKLDNRRCWETYQQV